MDGQYLDYPISNTEGRVMAIFAIVTVVIVTVVIVTVVIVTVVIVTRGKVFDPSSPLPLCF